MQIPPGDPATTPTRRYVRGRAEVTGVSINKLGVHLAAVSTRVSREPTCARHGSLTFQQYGVRVAGPCQSYVRCTRSAARHEPLVSPGLRSGGQSGPVAFPHTS